METTTITVGTMRQELLALRKRTGDDTLSHTVKQGRFQLCRVVYDARGNSTVTPLSPWQDATGHLRSLQTFGAAHPLSEYTRGTIVTIVPEWRDSPEEIAYVVVGEDEGKGRLDISPVVWTHGPIVPVETVRTFMVQRV